MNHNNHIEKMNVTSTIKKIQVLGPIIFRDCSIPQEIQKSIKVLRPKIFKDCSTPQKIQISNSWEQKS